MKYLSPKVGTKREIIGTGTKWQLGWEQRRGETSVQAPALCYQC